MIPRRNSDPMEFDDLNRYGYGLPSELIRKRGVEPRDSARLFVYDTATDRVTHAVFGNLPDFLPERSLLVLNETRVVPARLMLRKETGGKIEVFVLVNEMEARASEIPVLVDRKCVPGMKLAIPDDSLFEVVRQEESRFFVRLRSGLTLMELLDRFGATPIPHYLETGDESAEEAGLRVRYQTVFARSGASVAAPTASLHFTDRVFADLERKKIGRTMVELDVGLGTFAPLRPEHFSTGSLHRERISVSEEAAERLNSTKREGDTVVAVGTTALRTLESVVTDDTEHPFRAFSGETDVFIFPPYRFRSADILLTNFHLPKSSLMLLVDAFLSDKRARRDIISLYDEAVREGYAFYSFGDSMLIL